jgi:hypothetical protein
MKCEECMYFHREHGTNYGDCRCHVPEAKQGTRDAGWNTVNGLNNACGDGFKLAPGEPPQER